LQTLRGKQVNASGFSTQPDGLSIGEQAVDGITVNGYSTPVTGLTDE